MFQPSRLREAVERLIFVAAAVVLFVMIPFETQAQAARAPESESAASAASAALP